MLARFRAGLTATPETPVAQDWAVCMTLENLASVHHRRRSTVRLSSSGSVETIRLVSSNTTPDIFLIMIVVRGAAMWATFM